MSSAANPMSSRLINIRVTAKPHISIIQVYAPTLDHEDEKVEFYELLDTTITQVPKDILFVQGD